MKNFKELLKDIKVFIFDVDGVLSSNVMNLNSDTGLPVRTGNVKDGFTITNTHEPKKTQVKATKIWADNNNQDDLRPDSITFTLTKGGVEVSNKTCVANKGNNWSCSIQDLDEYENGSKIVYGIKELGEIDGYTTSQPVCTGYACSVTNELTSPEKITIEATKEWEDDDYDVTLYYSLNQNECDELLEILKEN